ncbi:hypothetical protein D9M69_257990 [compost metagenome]
MRDVDVERLQVVLVRVDDAHHVLALDLAARAAGLQYRLQRHAFGLGAGGAFSGKRAGFAERGVIVDQRLAGMRRGAALHVFGRAGADHAAAGIAALGTQVDQPVGGADHVEVVLDHDQRMAAVEQLAEGQHQLGDIVEVQTRGRLVEHEQAARQRIAAGARRRGLRGFGKEAGQLQALRLAARQRRHGLAQLHVFEADIDNGLQHAQHRGIAGEIGRRFADGQFQHVGNAERARRLPGDGALDLYLQHFGAVAGAVAIRAAQVDVAEELHLDVLEARAAAGRAAPVAGVEAERARGIAALQRHRRPGEELADLVERPDVAGRVGARGLADRRLVDEHHVIDQVRAGQLAVRPRRFRRLAEMARQRRVQHVLQQRGLARARHAGHAHQPLQRDLYGDILQVVFGRAFQHDARQRVVDGAALPVRGIGHAAAPAEIGTGQRVGIADIGRRAVEHDMAAALARAGAHVDQAVRGEHHRGIVLDHHQRIARVAQPVHGLDDAVQVARVQADAGLVQHEQRIDQRGAERGGQVDALHFAAGQRAALAVQRQVAQADVAQVFQPRAHFGQQQLECVVQHRAGQRQFVKEAADALDRQQHQVMHGQAGQRLELRAVPVNAARQEAAFGRQHRVGIALRSQAPQQRLGLQARAAAGFAGGVAAVLGQQHPDVHLVRLRLQVAEEPHHAVPLLVPLAVPVGRAMDDPVALGLGHVGPGRVARDAGLAGVAHQVVLAFFPGRGLHRLDRAFAQRLARIGNDQPEVDPDHAAEAPAGFAGAVGGIEREQRGLRVGIAQVAVRAMQAGGKAPHGAVAAIGQHIDVDASAAALERGFDRLHHAHLFGIADAEAVGHHVKQLARAGGRLHHALRLHARVTADGEPLLDLFLGRRFRQLHRERHHQPRIVVRLPLRRARQQLSVDRLRRIVAHRLRGLLVEQLRRACVEQLQVVVQLGHRADRRARAAHRVGLVDGDRRRHAVDALDLRAIHPVQELARVGAEGLDVAALALGIERVEYQAGLARAGRPGHHGHLAGAQVEVDILEVVLAGAANANQLLARHDFFFRINALREGQAWMAGGYRPGGPGANHLSTGPGQARAGVVHALYIHTV